MLTDVSHTLFYVNINESSNCLHIFPITKKRAGVGVGLGVNGQKKMLTPRWHMILPLIFVKVRVCSAPFCIFYLDF